MYKKREYTKCFSTFAAHFFIMSKDTGQFSIWKILIPTFIGIGVILYMFLDEFNIDDLKSIPLNAHTVFWLLVALCCMLGRDAGFTIRYRYLTEKILSWKQCIKVTMLAEFGTAITPSVVGGSSMAVIFLSKENIPVGKSASMVFVTMLLDEMFFVVTFPILLLFIPVDELFYTSSSLNTAAISLFIAAYFLKVLLCVLLIIGLFFRPQAIRWLIIKVFRLPVLRKWHSGAVKAGDELIISSKEIRGKSFKFWIPLILATILSWCSRYFVVNAIFMAFFDLHDNLLIFARQFVMWIFMLITPTPGGTGVSEFIFKHYLGGIVPVAGLLPVIILLWRLLTYYNYLFIGAAIVPRWIQSRFKVKKKG